MDTYYHICYEIRGDRLHDILVSTDLYNEVNHKAEDLLPLEAFNITVNKVRVETGNSLPDLIEG